MKSLNGTVINGLPVSIKTAQRKKKDSGSTGLAVRMAAAAPAVPFDPRVKVGNVPRSEKDAFAKKKKEAAAAKPKYKVEKSGSLKIGLARKNPPPKPDTVESSESCDFSDFSPTASPNLGPMNDWESSLGLHNLQETSHSETDDDFQRDDFQRDFHSTDVLRPAAAPSPSSHSSRSSRTAELNVGCPVCGDQYPMSEIQAHAECCGDISRPPSPPPPQSAYSRDAGFQPPAPAPVPAPVQQPEDDTVAQETFANFWTDAAAHGEEAARAHYKDWAPPVGAVNPNAQPAPPAPPAPRQRYSQDVSRQQANPKAPSVPHKAVVHTGKTKEFFRDLSVTSASVDNGYAHLAEGAFLGCKNLSDVTLPPSIRAIKSEALMGCSSLRTIAIPPSVSVIGDHALYGTGLTSVELPGGATSIGAHSFSNCEHLTTVTWTPTAYGTKVRCLFELVGFYIGCWYFHLPSTSTCACTHFIIFNDESSTN